MRNLLRRLAWTLLVVAVVIQVFRPSRENPVEAPGNAIEAHLMLPEPVHDILARACFDCHSYRTDWPWYSQVAPVSWFLASHVKDARRHLNISRWSEYGSSRAAEHLSEMCSEAKEREMPLASYRLLHPEARLTNREIEAICAWTESARRAILERERATGPMGEAPPGPIIAATEGFPSP